MNADSYAGFFTEGGFATGPGEQWALPKDSNSGRSSVPLRKYMVIDSERSSRQVRLCLYAAASIMIIILVLMLLINDLFLAFEQRTLPVKTGGKPINVTKKEPGESPSPIKPLDWWFTFDDDKLRAGCELDQCGAPLALDQ